MTPSIECRYAECFFAEYRYTGCSYAKCRYAGCLYGQCHGAWPLVTHELASTLKIPFFIFLKGLS